MTSGSIPAESSGNDYGRPESIEERSNHLVIHPLSELVAKCAVKFGVSANQLSVSGLVFGLFAAAFYFYQPDKMFVTAGFLAMAMWHVFDGADGRVARATGTSSAFGRIIDGICDHLVFASVYISLTLSMISGGAPLTIWFLVVAAGISHAIQAAAYEERRQRYQRRTKGVAREAVNEKLLEVDGRQSFFATIYDFVQRMAGGDASQLDVVLDRMRGQNTAPDIVQSVVNRTAWIVRRWSILNANNRTLMIAFMCLLGQPVFYFVYELIVLNAVLVALLIYERRAETIIVRDVTPFIEGP